MKSLKVFKKKAKALLARPLPYGLFSISFFSISTSERAKLHRNVCFSARGNIPYAIWFLIQLFLAHRWRTRHAETETDRAIHHFGRLVEATEGIAISRQKTVILGLSKKYCLHPYVIYLIGTYRDPRNALDFIYPREMKLIHKMLNGHSESRDQMALQDKLEFSERSAQARLPVVPSIQVLSRFEAFEISGLLSSQESDLFIKSRSGFRGIGAFSLLQSRNGWSGQLLSGHTLDSLEEIDVALSNLLENDDALIQPYLQNHSRLQKLSPCNQPIVLRVVTLGILNGAEILSAYLRIPIIVSAGETNHQTQTKFEVLIDVDLNSGTLSANKGSSHHLNSIKKLTEERLLSMISDSTSVPFWDDVKRDSISAQIEFSQLWGVAWDWIVTEKQAYLLEGNVHWGMQDPQEISGGLAKVVINAVKRS